MNKLFTLMLVAACTGCTPQRPSTTSDISGTWQLESSIVGGKKESIPDSMVMLITYSNGQYKTHVNGTNRGNGTYVVHPSKPYPSLDVTIEHPSTDTFTVKSLYSLAGDKLTVWSSSVDDERPTGDMNQTNVSAQAMQRVKE